MPRNVNIAALLIVAGWAGLCRASPLPPAAASATITSDELQLVDQGAESIFVGHVVIKQDYYTLWADRVRQVKDTGIANAFGHVKALWARPGEARILGTGLYAKYDPNTEEAQLWNRAEITRWETEADTSPVHIKADHFISREMEQKMWAKGNVYIRRPGNFWSKSEDGLYNQAEQVVSLWGPQQVEMQYMDDKGAAHFFSDRAMVFLSPKRVRLLDHVKGHIVPAP
jgi:lipopolysaccharide transport protein LptA